MQINPKDEGNHLKEEEKNILREHITIEVLHLFNLI